MGWLQQLIEKERLPAAFARDVEAVWAPLAQTIGEQGRARPGLVVGLCGPQGSGKSTVAAVLERLLSEDGLHAVTLALDDLYLPRAEREALAARVHPLLRTRGPPGTHDVALGSELLDAVRRRGPARLPCFDKGDDDRSRWRQLEGPADVVLFEGWCVGARPQPDAALTAPVNALERDEDADGGWRRYVNEALAGPYQALFGRIDRLVLMQPPGFEVVAGWRAEQERKLRERTGQGMSEAEVARFVQHYERLSRWIMAEAPARADWVVELDAARRPVQVSSRK